MNKLNYPLLALSAFALFSINLACSKPGKSPADPAMEIIVPTQGNSWIFVSASTPSQRVNDFDSNAWTHSSQTVRTYFRLEAAGQVHIGIRAKANEGKSKVKVAFQGKAKEVEISSTSFTNIYIGSFEVEKAGYYHLDISGVSKSGSTFADLQEITLGGSATQAGVNFVFEEYFYWGRRGPSVHLGYQIPEGASDIRWFYNEVTVPAGNDVIGSFFMANGHAQGYFGMQVNSPSERRVLFSVWSPYTTDNPNDIPVEYRVELLRKGSETVVQEFGNEGSGGQSFLRYSWIAGNTYKFLLKIEPAANQTDKTDYTAWFYAPETGAWALIASWRRPFTSTYAKGLHSFLENFDTNTGPIGREVHYGNQWVCDINGTWHEVTRAKFTTDPTGRDKARLDYAGGYKADGNNFFLKNCGFFNETTTVDSYFDRTPTGTQPNINFAELE